MWPYLRVSSHAQSKGNRPNLQDQLHGDAVQTRLLQSQVALSWSTKALLFFRQMEERETTSY
jgi:hypothetical protein